LEITVKVIPGTKIRAIENYESKKESWLLQVASDTELPAGALRVAVAIGLHMNRKQRLLAWPGFTRLQKLLGIGLSTVIRGVKALERRDHMRVVRSRNGRKNNPNHYHPNIWRTGVLSAVTVGTVTDDTRVLSAVTPEPMNEPMREPTIRRKEDILFFKDSTHTEDKGLGEVERVETSPPRTTKLPLPAPRLEGIAGQAEAKPITLDYAAALDLLRPTKPQANRRCPAFLAVTDYLAGLAPELPHPLLKRSRDRRFLIEGPIGQRSA
jgi:hypothetical protein